MKALVQWPLGLRHKIPRLFFYCVFWVKNELLEEVHDDFNIALNNIAIAISTYNHLRPHGSIEMLTPVVAHQLSRPLKRTWKNYYKRKEDVMV